MALDLLLDNTAADRDLVVLTDSLSLMQTLEEWDREDFFPLPALQKHRDVIEPLSAKIRARDATTTLVKVKAHSGVPLNEAADVAADLGCSSDTLRFPVTCDRVGLLSLPHQHGQPVDFNKAVRSAVTRREIDSLRSRGGLVTESFLREGRGQQHLARARKRMPDKRARRMLQLLGGVFPCGMRSKRIGKATTDACALCKRLETPSHILCGCPELREIVTASHDKIWARLFEYLKSHLSSKWEMWYDAIGKMGI